MGRSVGKRTRPIRPTNWNAGKREITLNLAFPRQRPSMNSFVAIRSPFSGSLILQGLATCGHGSNPGQSGIIRLAYLLFSELKTKHLESESEIILVGYDSGSYFSSAD